MSVYMPEQHGWGLFGPFKLTELLKGASIYKFREFYEVKNTLIRSDGRADYVNLGLWRDGDETASPSSDLVELVASKLNLCPEDVILNIGSGLGQPDVDIVGKFPVKRIIGINMVPEQVAYANDKFKSLHLDGIIKHRVLNAHQLTTAPDLGDVTCVISVEAFAEIPGIEDILANAYKILPPGGRVCFCDIMRKDRPTERLSRMLRGGLMIALDHAIFNDHWRTVHEYAAVLEKTGFKNIQFESIGGKVYPSLYRYARKQFPVLRKRKIPAPLWLLALLSYVWDVLFSWGQIDYGVFYAEK
jgi:cyclopropane fatty-acyl-phospholipid synthase-like methyltransferase